MSDLDYETTKYDDFAEMDLPEKLLRGIYSYGFEKPSEIQQKAIVPISKGKDIIGQAQSGTGKTGTFAIGSLARCDDTPEIQIMIVVPTHELATQIGKVFDSIGNFMDIKCIVAIGGSSIRDTIFKIRNGAKVIVGTPGRIEHLLKERIVKTDNLKTFIMDEADSLLYGNFLPNMIDIINYLHDQTQIVLISATYEKLDMNEIARELRIKPVKIIVKKEELTLEGIKQYYINIGEERYKLDTLQDIYALLTITQTIIYVNTRKKVDWLQQMLTEKDFTVSCMHSDMTHTERKDIMRLFTSGVSRILISTDLLARGIDIQQVSVVINYDIPKDRDSYLHRIGRSGRFGRKGVAINFTTKYDYDAMMGLQEYYNTQIEEMPDDITRYL
jgi:translation initiation factor 4A